MDKAKIHRLAAALTEKIARDWADKGMLLRGGFELMRAQYLPPDASAASIEVMRFVYMAGAQHLFATMTAAMDAGDGITANELRRMSMIHAECEEWRKQAEALLIDQPAGSA